MESDLIDPLTLLKGLAILTAIPVVGMALWLEYFWGYIEEVKKEDPSEHDPADEAQKLRFASLTALILQLLLFLGSGETRKIYPMTATALFAVASFLHIWMQSKAERRLLPEKKPTTDPSAQVGWAFRAFLWSALGGVLYIGILLAAIRFSFILVSHFKVAAPWNAGVMLGGLILGILGGLGTSFALGPFQLRKMFPTSPLSDERIRADIETCFRENGLAVPGLWTVDLEGLQSHNVLLAGFRGGRGIFRPALFISKPLLTSVEPHELRAIILHEVSHLKMAHLKNRFVFTAGLIMAASMMSGALVFVSHLLLPSSGLAPFVGFASLIGTFLGAFRMMERQAWLQEIEADIHTIKLGARIENLEGALQKLDQLNGVTEKPETPGSKRGTHPSSRERMEIVRAYFAKNTEKEPAPAEEKKAA